MKNFLATASILILFTTLPFIAHAEDPEELTPIEVSVSRFNTLEDDYPGSVEIITAEEIKQSGHPQVVDLLREQLGIDMVQNGPKGTNATVIMRGGDPDATLVMIDGVQVNSNTTGSFNFGNLNLDNVERIEILRGPQSTIWGADASTGVINIVTKKGKGKPTHSANFEFGSFDTFYESLSSSGSVNNFDYSFSVSKMDTQGFSAVNERFATTRTDDGFENTTVNSKIGIGFSDRGRLELVGRFSDSTVQIDSFQADSPSRVSDNESFQFSTPIKMGVTDWWDVRLKPYISYDKVTNQIYNRNYTLDFQNNLYLNDNYSFVVGMEYEVLNGNNVGSNFKRTTYNQGYYLQSNFDYGNRINLTAGFRHDVNSVFKDPTTYKFEGAYKFLDAGTRVHIAHATGFRAPSFNQLFFPNFGDPTLVPEESKSSEVGVRQSLMDGKIKLSMTYFFIEFKNFINTSTATQKPSARNQGIESQVQIKLPYNTALTMNHTWQNAIDQNGTELSRRAKHNFSSNLSKKFGHGISGLLGMRARSRVRTNTSGSQIAEGFVTLRTAWSLEVSKALRATLRVENLLDKKYEEVFGFSTQGVSAFVGATYNFN